LERMMDWQELFAAGVTIGDGALGTRLVDLSGLAVELPEALTLDPVGREHIGRVHREYLEAGARIIETNTFAANSRRLERVGLAEQCELINRTAAQIARSAVGDAAALVAGSVGPLDLGLAEKDTSEEEVASVYRRQIEALAGAGVDVLFLETFSSVLEARAALVEAKRTGLPVFFCLGGQSISRAYARRTVERLVELAEEMAVEAVGANCMPPYDLGRVLTELAGRTSRPLMAYPNAGTPTVVRGVIRFDLPQAVLLAEAQGWLAMGVQVFGGCCGTAPEHIRALSEALAGKPVVPRSARIEVRPRVKSKVEVPAAVTLDPNHPIRRVLREAARPVIAVEVRSSLGRSLAQTVDAAGVLVEAGADLLDVPDNPGGNPGRDCVACAYLLQERYTIPTIFHKSATQANALQLHSYLLGAADLGVRGLLAVTGDPPHVGPFDRWASRVGDIRSSVELLRLVGLLRAGQLINGQPLPEPVDFAAGCGFAPTMNLESQTPWLERKIDAGAEYVFSQPVFRLEDYQRMREATRHIEIPIFTGLFVLTSSRQAEYLRSGKIPGIVVPEDAAGRIAEFSDPADQAKAGLEMTHQMIDRLAGESPGIYLIMPFHRESFAWTAELVRHAASLRKPVD